MWKLLNIEETRDTEEIRQAYETELAKIDQRTQAAKYQALKSAFNQAMTWANKNKEVNSDPRTSFEESSNHFASLDNKSFESEIAEVQSYENSFAFSSQSTLASENKAITGYESLSLSLANSENLACFLSSLSDSLSDDFPDSSESELIFERTESMNLEDSYPAPFESSEDLRLANLEALLSQIEQLKVKKEPLQQVENLAKVEKSQQEAAPKEFYYQKTWTTGNQIKKKNKSGAGFIKIGLLILFFLVPRLMDSSTEKDKSRDEDYSYSTELSSTTESSSYQLDENVYADFLGKSVPELIEKRASLSIEEFESYLENRPLSSGSYSWLDDELVEALQEGPEFTIDEISVGAWTGDSDYVYFSRTSNGNLISPFIAQNQIVGYFEVLYYSGNRIYYGINWDDDIELLQSVQKLYDEGEIIKVPK